MIFQLEETVRNLMLEAFEDRLVSTGAPHLKIRSGSIPANCAAGETGGSLVLADLTLPNPDPFAAASGGSMSKAGTWEDLSADNSGTAAHWRLYLSNGTTCVAQGDVTATGNGGSLTVDNVVFAAAQAFTITGFTLTQGGG